MNNSNELDFNLAVGWAWENINSARSGREKESTRIICLLAAYKQAVKAITLARNGNISSENYRQVLTLTYKLELACEDLMCGGSLYQALDRIKGQTP